MFDICFVDGVDDVIEYHVKAENTFNHFIDGMLFGNMLKNHSVHGCYGSCPVAAMPAMEQKRALPVVNNLEGCNQVVETELSCPGTKMMQAYGSIACLVSVVVSVA